MQPHTGHTKSGDVYIACQMTGNGPLDNVYLPDRVSHLEYAREEPSPARLYQHRSTFSHHRLFVKQGTRLSNRGLVCGTLTGWKADAVAEPERIGGPRMDSKFIETFIETFIEIMPGLLKIQKQHANRC